jgi:biopolymer transport protein ExbB/TolQ
LRTLADTDAVALEGSYALIRFITWAIPILGFLGTVLGITQSISSLTPEQMEKDLGAVTSGLALAFDATALGLGLTMIVMFVTYIVDRVEQGMMQAVDHFADRQLAHRFERPAGATNEFIEATRRSTQVLTEAVEMLVEKQAVVWAKAFNEASARREVSETQTQQRLTTGLELALERTLAAHEKRLVHVEHQSAAHLTQIVERLGSLSKLADVLARQAETLARVQEGERHLIRLQEELHHNLDTLADAGSFQQAVHSLTAAIHLLTMQASPRHEGRQRPGAAA